jgi:NhaP-type Na+/H+ or K+/H+ antiporter
MSEQLLQQIVLILACGAGAQWLAWRFKVPSILLLLVTGFLAGPVFHLLDPDAIMGDALMPLVSLSVGIILFEGGLTLNFREWKQIGAVVRNLLVIGVVVTWGLGSLAARYILGWDWSLSILLGAVLVVTGPTVILPLLRHVRPSRAVGNALKWEGILIDPVGALLALLVFEAIIANTQVAEFSTHALRGFGITFIVGMAFGWVGARILLFVFKRNLVPEFLHNSVTLTLVAALFTGANMVQHESGLLAVTIMGVFLANQQSLDVHHIIDFKENLRTLLIASLFILLASRLSFDELSELDWSRGLLFLLVMVLVVRPVSVFASTLFSDFNIREKLFISWLAPRGIVAAAVASIFALRLESAGVESASQLVPATFLIIVGTVTIYGLTSLPLAKALGLAQPDPQGVLLLGATPFSIQLAEVLQRESIDVLLVDTNRYHLKEPRLNGIPTWHGNILGRNPEESVNLQGIGYLMALTPNDEVNSLAAIQMRTLFGKDSVFQLAPPGTSSEDDGPMSSRLSGRFLFGPGQSYFLLNSSISRKIARIKATRMTDEFTFDDFLGNQQQISTPLLVIKPGGMLHIWDFQNQPQPQSGDIMVHLAAENPNPATTAEAGKS